MASKVGFLGFAVLVVVLLCNSTIGVSESFDSRTGVSALCDSTIGVSALCNINNGVSANGCDADIQGLVSQCAPFVFKAAPKTPPTQGCCDVIQKADIPCVCQYITPEIEQVVSIEKVIYVAQFCHKDLPRGTKCGSVSIPPAMKRN
ncbi:hypothetical protein C5167_001880 [Papaver somniferum]|uniref:Bifunctional inhibitor/plant lipid transfer protein/seed storage helical domain-containing protein n=1 Tax=Papaver somniferum TaxID=3469 RepID=A0A4Y7KXZ6_PAPSO|nr:uncharacterized protein LOC113308092 [Papaver somniferum]RZC77657.1 hypothetical protein C5167_001880 [Papaver somniferum]